MTSSVIQTFKVHRSSIWTQDFSLADANGNMLAKLTFLNALKSEAKVETPNKTFFLERNAMGAEISIYDGESDEEIALLESKISMTSMDYQMRFRYKEDKYTFSRRSI